MTRTRLTRRRKTFKSEVLSGHKGHALELPFDPGETWNVKAQTLWRGHKGFEVEANINGVAFESFAVARQKKFYLLVEDKILEAAGLAVGDIVTASVSAGRSRSHKV